jgi:hypothetical protein
MNRRIAMSTALCATVLAAGAFVVPTARAGNVAWGVSIGAPGFSVAVGQPGYYGGRGYYRAPFVPVARPYWRPYYRPYAYRPIVVVPQPAYVAPPVTYSYYAPGPYWSPR